MIRHLLLKLRRIIITAQMTAKRTVIEREAEHFVLGRDVWVVDGGAGVFLDVAVPVFFRVEADHARGALQLNISL